MYLHDDVLVCQIIADKTRGSRAEYEGTRSFYTSYEHMLCIGCVGLFVFFHTEGEMSL